MHIKIGLAWQINGERLDAALPALLEAIAEGGSLKQAALDCGLSYRHAWGLLRKLEGLLHSPLVRQQRGRAGGTALTQAGQALRAALQATDARLAPLLAEQAQRLQDAVDPFGNISNGMAGAPLRISASSDLLISLLSKSLPEHSYEFATRGSMENLRRLGKRQCDAAGFHLPQGRLWERIRLDYRRRLDALKPQLMMLAQRRQGLILRDKSKIRCLQDLCKRAVGFVNRQDESGTRILFDELLRQHNVDRGKINGYHRIEYTHLAVARVISSGEADAGFGIETAAMQFKLHFIPLVKELYLLAFRPGEAQAGIGELRRCLNGAPLRTALAGLPGYKTGQTGNMISLPALYELR